MNTLPKQIVEDDIPYDENNHKSFKYRFTNLTHKEINENENKTLPVYYDGMHKGKPYDGYMCSPENKQFPKDFMDGNCKWRYEVNVYGTEEYCKAVEATTLREENAISNPLWYNDSLGSSSVKLPNLKLIEDFVKQVRDTKSYQGVGPTLKRVDNLSKNKIQIREFSLQSSHVNDLKDIINDTHTLEHLLIVILKDREYQNVVGDLIIDGNHSIVAAEKSKFGKQGLIPVLEIPKHLHELFDDTEVDLSAVHMNPTKKNPELESSLEDIARQVANLKLVKSIDSTSPEVKRLYNNFNLTSAKRTKVTKMAKKMIEDVIPNTNTTWANYGVGELKKKIDEIHEDECITKGNTSDTYSKCYSTAKYNAWADLFNMTNWNKENPNKKIKTYRVRWYHPDSNYKNTWENELEEKNIIAIESCLKNEGIDIDWTYLPTRVNKLTVVE